MAMEAWPLVVCDKSNDCVRKGLLVHVGHAADVTAVASSTAGAAAESGL